MAEADEDLPGVTSAASVYTCEDDPSRACVLNHTVAINTARFRPSSRTNRR